ncbi:MAG TPA: right-handed parallel beta-helix repeat-containing protein [Lacunisphaera sp.]|nr:right-handed parallel beta-helix repeat-containing protein [Lacunisphaera sp.]
MKSRTFRQLTLLGTLVIAPFIFAQPSGGPYGPQPQVYEVPKDAAHVFYVAPDGQADAAGTLEAPTTIESALAKVVTGDAVILRGGTYRTGGLLLSQGITLQPYRDEQPVLKGTQVADKWVALRDGYWRTPWKTLFPSKPRDWWQRDREGMRTPLHRFNNDMVFIDGVPLKSAGWEGELDASSYYIDYDAGMVYLRTDPTNKLVEITAWDIGLLRTSKTAHGKPNDHQGPAIRGITFTQYAYRALEVEGKRGAVPATEEPTDDPIGVADPATFGKEVVGTLVENCAITHCSRVAGYFRGDHLVIRNCLVSDTSTEGIYVIGSSDCLLERNIIARNNVEQFTGYYPSAVKIFNQTRRVTCRDNVVIDNPNSNGIWYDVGNVDGVFVNNWIEGCYDGFFWEISKGVTVAGNVFVNCTKGVRILNSSGAKVYHNTFVNATASFERNERSAAADHFAWHPATGPDVHEREGHVFSGNLMVADRNYARPLFRAEQSAALKDKLKAPMFTATDANVYVRPAGVERSLITWSPGAADLNQFEFKTLAELHAKLPAFEAHSLQFALEPGAILLSPELKNFRPVRTLPVKATIPANVATLLGWPKQDAYAPGAYQK